MRTTAHLKKNWITCSLCHAQHSLKISERSVHNFLSYFSNRQTNKNRQKHNLLGGGKYQQKLRKCVVWRVLIIHVWCKIFEGRRNLWQALSRGVFQSAGVERRRNFPTDICKFAAEEIVVCSKFNFCSYIFRPHKTIQYFWKEKISTRKTFSDELKLGGAGEQYCLSACHVRIY